MDQSIFTVCHECKRKKKCLKEICQQCYKANTLFTTSYNKCIDTFIKTTLINCPEVRKMEFVHYHKFDDVKFIAEGRFSKIYKATWIDGPISKWNKEKQKYERIGETIVALKELNTKPCDTKFRNYYEIL
jgi:hypothetical protein